MADPASGSLRVLLMGSFRKSSRDMLPQGCRRVYADGHTIVKVKKGSNYF
jgi:hypothetical protein